MRPLCFLAFALVLGAVPLHAGDALADARRLYNQGQFDAAEQAAQDAVKVPATVDGARLVIGRIQLERYRRTPAAADLSGAIATFRSIDARRLDARERVELAIGFGESLYLDDRFAAAALLFESMLDASQALGAVAHERLLDWWATAMERQAQLRPASERTEIYGRLSSRMAVEISRDSGSTPAAYWLAASARGAGDPERALNQATAAWVRSALARDGGVALRADLDRLVVQGILPDRASRLGVRDHTQALAGMVGEWEAFKAAWSR